MLLKKKKGAFLLRGKDLQDEVGLAILWGSANKYLHFNAKPSHL
jgi:hypothetical protein